MHASVCVACQHNNQLALPHDPTTGSLLLVPVDEIEDLESIACVLVTAVV